MTTTSTFESKMYQKEIISKGYTFIFKDEWQIIINNLIQNIKENKTDKKNFDIWNELIETVRKESVEIIIIACTDLTVVSQDIPTHIDIIDSSKCLSESIISNYLKQETEK